VKDRFLIANPAWPDKVIPFVCGVRRGNSLTVLALATQSKVRAKGIHTYIYLCIPLAY